MGSHSPLSMAEIFGLQSFRTTLRQAAFALRGDNHVPKSRFDHTSLGILTPKLSISTWRGSRVCGRFVPILNLFNHTPTPICDGWSVRITQTQDFRGGRLTYDSHNGTDFVVPPGTVVCTAAAGHVASIRREFHRGGLKLYIDHGDGVFTSYNHLARALVRVGDTVKRGRPIALSGYSGIDGLSAFPWVAPHVHFNVMMGGQLVDPFARPEEESLWRSPNQPRPAPKSVEETLPEPSRFPEDAVQSLLAELIDPQHRASFLGGYSGHRLASELLIEATTYPTRFRCPSPGQMLSAHRASRRPLLDLPFDGNEWDGVTFIDDLGYR